jgi:hypothetical protein
VTSTAMERDSEVRFRGIVSAETLYKIARGGRHVLWRSFYINMLFRYT